MQKLSAYTTTFPFPPFSLASSPFTDDQLEKELRLVDGRKAVPSHMKILASPLSSLLTGWCDLWFRAGQLPDEWRSGWSVFLTKPNKAPVQSNALRPSALQTPSCSCLCNMLVRMLFHTWWPIHNLLVCHNVVHGMPFAVFGDVEAIEDLSAKWSYNASRLTPPEGPKPKLFGGRKLFLGPVHPDLQRVARLHQHRSRG